MLANLFLGFSKLGAEWVLYLLVAVSILSIAVILERALFYRRATLGLAESRRALRADVSAGKLDQALKQLETRPRGLDLETEMAAALLKHAGERLSPEILTEVAQDAVVRARVGWERNLSILATIGSNAPFIGLFGTVLGIIKAFHDLSNSGGATGGAQAAVTAGISEALVATAIGILVAIPAMVAFNLFQRRLRSGICEAEALKSFLISRLHAHGGGGKG